MPEDRNDDAEADEDGGRGDEEYEKIKTLRKTVGSGGKVATMSQHTRTRREARGEGLVNETK